MELDELVKTKENEKKAVDAYAAMQAGGFLQSYQYTPKELGPMEVEIKISHCGMCHTDLHLINNEMGISSYPLIPGDEIVGKVSQIGSAVTELNIGQRVGVGWLAGADFTCEQCTAGKDNLCQNGQPTCVGHEGGYAKYVYADARMAFPIPDALASEHAAPLLCAGITVFAPLLRHRVTGNSRLGVIGIGGLGHLALQYGRALGCHVTAFSTSSDKEEEAKHFGASRFVDASQPAILEKYANTCDFILSTATAGLPWADYINVLKPDGKLCIVGIPDSNIQISALQLILGQKSVISSVIGSRSEMQAMLEFSARHNIVPQIETYPINEINTVLERLSKNEVRYRAVLEID